MTSGSATPFADFNAARMPDITALGEYAWHLMQNVKSTDPARKATKVAMRILSVVGKALRIDRDQVEDKLFGRDSDCTPYREIFEPWIAKRDRLFPKVYAVMAFGTRARTRGRDDRARRAPRPPRNRHG